MSAAHSHLDAELVCNGSHSVRQLGEQDAIAGVYVHDAAGPEQVGVVDGLHPHSVYLQVNQVPSQYF